MKIIDINNLKKYKDVLVLEGDKINIGFTTAESDRSFNRHTDEGRGNLHSLIKDFQSDRLVYLNQIHSDITYIYNNENVIEFNENEGDAVITDNDGTMIGVFTADCVPVIIYDEEKGVIAAIHSGWKGTFNSICSKVVEKFVTEFQSQLENIKVVIGPHIRKCCYEVSIELKEKFIKQTRIDEEKLFDGRKLSMEVCIENDLLKCGIIEDNIVSLNLCTYCEEKIKLFSYRKSEGTYGRLFSFIYKK